MVQVTEVHMSSGGSAHEHIVSVKWVNPTTSERGETTKGSMVTFIRGGGQATVSDGIRTINVEVRDAQPPYIQTRADGIWSDNLLSLPRF